MKEKEKSETEKAVHALLENRIVKIGAVIAVTLGSLYILSRAFKVIGGTVNSFREMADSFRK